MKISVCGRVVNSPYIVGSSLDIIAGNCAASIPASVSFASFPNILQLFAPVGAISEYYGNYMTEVAVVQEKLEIAI
jgi:hypothetical protein